MTDDVAARDDGGPAFACDPNPKAWPGMTLRQWYAGQALVGEVAFCEDPIEAARRAFAYADAMLAQERA